MTRRQYKAIINYVKSNGGATIDAWTGALTMLKTGYMVSLAGYEKKHKKMTFRALSKAQKIAQKAGGFLGLWVDDGVIYSDVSTLINNKTLALFEGVKNNQIAIYDNTKQQSIYLK